MQEKEIFLVAVEVERAEEREESEKRKKREREKEREMRSERTKGKETFRKHADTGSEKERRKVRP